MTTSTPASGWHADEALLDRYLRGDAGAALGSSIEAHLLRCDGCRDRIRPLVDPAPLRDVWVRLEESVQAPRPGVLQRVARRLGVAEHDALLLSAAPALRAGWVLGTTLALAFAAVAALGGGARGVLLFLVVAPLAPVAGVAVSYGPEVDGAYEPTLAAPYSSSRLLMLRALAILVTSMPLAALGGLLLPGSAWSAATWLLPAAACVALTLAGSTWTSPARAATVVAVGWLAVIAWAYAPDGSATTALLTGPALPLYVAVGLAAALVFRARSARLALMGRNA
jgi:hypothetical protein